MESPVAEAWLVGPMQRMERDALHHMVRARHLNIHADDTIMCNALSAKTKERLEESSKSKDISELLRISLSASSQWSSESRGHTLSFASDHAKVPRDGGLICFSLLVMEANNMAWGVATGSTILQASTSRRNSYTTGTHVQMRYKKISGNVKTCGEESYLHSPVKTVS